MFNWRINTKVNIITIEEYYSTTTKLAVKFNKVMDEEVNKIITTMSKAINRLDIFNYFTYKVYFIISVTFSSIISSIVYVTIIIIIRDKTTK